MKIETKFEIGDEVWFMKDNKAILDKIQFIQIAINHTKRFLITYICNSAPDAIGNSKVSEDMVFKTKEELIKSL